MSDPMNTTEVAVEQRLVGLMSATKALRDMSHEAGSREVIARPLCLDHIEIVRDALSEILDEIGGK